MIIIIYKYNNALYNNNANNIIYNKYTMHYLLLHILYIKLFILACIIYIAIC